jgi:hypothetical protein
MALGDLLPLGRVALQIPEINPDNRFSKECLTMRLNTRLPGALVPAALVSALVLAAGSTVALRAADTKETFTAEAANMSNVGRGGALGHVDVTITRYSTDAEREQLRTALMENGTEALLKQLQKMPPVGYIRGNDSVGWDLRYAHEVQEGGGRRIVFATDRPISWLEAANSPRTMNYRFTIGELKLTGGKGEGSLAVAVKVKYDPESKTIELENYASEPLRLLNVHKLS